MEVIPFAESATVLAGQIAGKLERVGRPIGLADSMIAAIALVHGLDLVSGNTTHFHRVQQLGYPLALANWRRVIWPRRTRLLLRTPPWDLFQPQLLEKQSMGIMSDQDPVSESPGHSRSRKRGMR